MKIAVVGGAGFIGSQLARVYLDVGHDVLVVDALVNGSRDAVDTRARFYKVDSRDGKLQTIFQQERPDVVSYHVAQRECLLGGERPLADADVYVRGLLNVLDSCVSAMVRKVIFASGGNDLYAPVSAEKLPLTEDAPICPQRSQDICKAVGEWYVRYYGRQHGLKYTILRYADVYGETDRAQVRHPLSYFVQMLARGQRPVIRGSGREVRDHIFIGDVVRANLCALERGQGATLHISSGQGYTVEQLYWAVADLLGSEIQPVYVSGALEEATPVILDNERARRVLGWWPEVDFTEGVRRAVGLLCVPVAEPVVREAILASAVSRAEPALV